MWAAIVAIVALAVSGGVMNWHAGKMQRDLNDKLAQREAGEQRKAANAQADSALAQADLADREAAQIDRQANAYEAQGLVDSANAQRNALAVRQQGNVVSGQGRSLAAASGFAMNSPSILKYLTEVESATDAQAGGYRANAVQARTNSLLQAFDAREQAASQRYISKLQRYSADWIRVNGENQAERTIWQAKVQNAIEKQKAKAGLTQLMGQTVASAYGAYAGGASGAAVSSAGTAANSKSYQPLVTGSGGNSMYANYGAGGYSSPYGPYNSNSLYGRSSVYGSYNSGYG